MNNIIEKAVEWAINTANDDTHGYDNRKDHRGGDPDYACSSFVNEAFRQAGLSSLPESKSVYTSKMKSTYTKNDLFTDVTKSITLKSGKGLQKGDILLTPGKHVELYIGDGKIAGARGDANSGKAQNGKAGDQTGAEIAVSTYYNFPWKYVLRYNAPVEKQYIVQCGAYLTKSNANKMSIKINNAGFATIVKKSGIYWIVQAGVFSNKNNAQKLVNQIKEKGFNAIIK